MKHIVLSVMLLCSIIIFTGCPNTDTVAPDATNFKGYIYYSNGGETHRMRLSDQTKTTLFTNAWHPDVANNGEILCLDNSPKERIILADITGANRKAILTNVDYKDPDYKQYLNKPRISYNQEYVAYYNSLRVVTYVVRVNDGSLAATIGDFNNSYKNPVWAPDGSLVFQGEPTSKNNGIYKVSPDFTSIVRIDPNLTNVSEPSVSPDGKSIAFIRDEQVWTMGFDGSNPTQLYAGGNYRFGMLTWSPDSKYIAVVNTLASSGHIHILDVQAKTLPEITKSHYVGSSEQLSWRY